MLLFNCCSLSTHCFWCCDIASCCGNSPSRYTSVAMEVSGAGGEWSSGGGGGGGGSDAGGDIGENQVI